MAISWRLIITIILVLFFLYLLYNALKIVYIMNQANKNLKKRQKIKGKMDKLHDQVRDLTRELKEGPK